MILVVGNMGVVSHMRGFVRDHREHRLRPYLRLEVPSIHRRRPDDDDAGVDGVDVVALLPLIPYLIMLFRQSMLYA
jgi:hypothetical protein